ncbi:MAG: tRNA-dihydrouridine synthase [bacterium]|nr:tRNA-dihydrouridine synthase [bacterium]
MKKPIMALAPMAEVTDAAFRRIIAKYGKPDVMYTEFVSADGLFLADERGRRKIEADLSYSEAERPIVAQFFTSRPDMMERAAAYAREHNFDGVDINMGCPDRSVEKQGAGASLMKNPALARELIQAAKRGAGELPVSVKTRIGYGGNSLSTWLPELLAEEPASVTIHARTRSEMSKVPARWEHIREAALIRDRIGVPTLILGNGDVADLDDARKKVATTGADGAMLGRAIFGNPSLFSNSHELGNNGKAGVDTPTATIQQRVTVLAEHTRLFDELLGNIKSFSIMKKHFKAYVSGWNGAAELRMRLMECNTAEEVENRIQEHLHAP